MSKYLIAYDIGTTNNKVAIFDPSGRVVVQKDAMVPLKINAHGEGWMEKDANQIWCSLCEITQSALREANIDRDKIAGVGVTAARQCIVPVDEKGDALRDVIMWGTKATFRQVQYMEDRVGSKRVHEITTRPINPVWAAPSILYILQEEKEVAAQTYKVLEIEDFILYKLGSDKFYSDHSQSGCIELYDIFARNWSEELCNALEVPMGILPELVEAGTIVGEVNGKASELTGIPVGIPIIAGGGDCQTSAVGCGVVSPGKANIVIGSAGVGSIYIEEPVSDPESRFVCSPHSIKDIYVVDNNTLNGGIAYKWFVDSFCENGVNDHKNKHEMVNQMVKRVPVGSGNVLFLPHLAGTACPYWDAQAKGVFVGMTLNTGRAEMARAVIEGSCMDIGKGFHAIEEMGFPLDEIIACGGACVEGSPWNQIQADIYGKPIKLTKTSENTALGCAMLISVACGIYKSLEEATDSMVRYNGTLTPSIENHKKYKKLMEIHDEIYHALKDRDIYKNLFFGSEQ